MIQHDEAAPEREAADRPPTPPDRAKRTERQAEQPVPEIGGPKGPEPTRYGDWEKGGRCTDF